MKTVITSTGEGVKSNFDLRFGRASWFCVYDHENGSTEFYKNDQENAGHGAGPKAAEKMAELGASKIISGDFGPKAKDLLEKLNIQMIIMQAEGSSIEDIINKLKN